MGGSGSCGTFAISLNVDRDHCRAQESGNNLEETGLHTRHPGTRYEETFAIAPEARDEFRAATRVLAKLTGPTVTDERYDVYLLR